MRAILIATNVLLIMAAHALALDYDVFSNNAGPVLPSALVSFSIGYPKGWTVCETPGPQQHQDFGPLYDTSPVWNFVGPGSTNLQNFTVTICPSDDATAKEAAETFTTDASPSGPYRDGRLSAVKTSAGDSGWLVESKGCVVFYPAWLANDPAWPVSKNIVSDLPRMEQDRRPSIKVPVIFDNFFFRSESPGNKAGIQIQIMTNAADSSRRAELEKLVLQTLRFNNP